HDLYQYGARPRAPLHLWRIEMGQAARVRSRLREACQCQAPLGGAAGVDGQDSPGDVPRLVAKQELDRVGDVLDLGQALKRAAPRNSPSLLSLKRLRHIGVDETRRYRIDVNPVPAHFAGERA